MPMVSIAFILFLLVPLLFCNRIEAFTVHKGGDRLLKSTTSIPRLPPLLRMRNDDVDMGKTSPFLGFTGGLATAANFVVDYSLYVVKTTGCNLVPKDSIEGLLLEQGASIALVLGVFTWSVATKVKTGSGLPAGPAGLLGAAEGLSFLTVLGGIVVVVLNLGEYGGFLKEGTVCDGLSVSKPLGFI